MLVCITLLQPQGICQETLQNRRVHIIPLPDRPDVGAQCLNIRHLQQIQDLLSRIALGYLCQHGKRNIRVQRGTDCVIIPGNQQLFHYLRVISVHTLLQ